MAASLCNPTFHHIQDNYLPLNNGGGGPLYTTDTSASGNNQDKFGQLDDVWDIPPFDGGDEVTSAYENNDEDITLASIWKDVLLHELSQGYGGGGGNQLYPATHTGATVPYFGGGGQNQAYSAADNISFYGGGIQLVDGDQPYPTTESGGDISFYGGRVQLVNDGDQSYPTTESGGNIHSYGGGVQLVDGDQPYPTTESGGDIHSYGGGVQLVDGDQPYPTTESGGDIHSYGGGGGNQSCPATFSGGNNDISLASICNGDDVHLHDDVSAGYGGGGGENQAAESGGNICSRVQVVDGDLALENSNEMEAILGNLYDQMEIEMEAILGNMYDQFHHNHHHLPHPHPADGGCGEERIPTTGGGDEVGAAQPTNNVSGSGEGVAAIHAKMYEELYRNQYLLPAAISGSDDGWWMPAVGCRFQPSDEELITEFLVPELIGSTTPASRVMMRHADIYDYHPSQLQQLANHYHYCDSKMYFFTPIDKIGNIRTHRSIKSNQGFWKATQSAKDIHDQSGNLIGSKTPLTYVHNSDDDDKTKWLMSEYKLPQHSHHLVLAVVYRKRDNINND